MDVDGGVDGPGAERVLCCECAVPIAPNAVNMCAVCLQTNYDIGAGISKQVQQNTCRGCERFERRDGTWAAVEPESKELLALLLRKPRGLTAVRLIDASYIWTEPHSRRIKLKLTVQKEVAAAAVLQQSFVVEYVLSNKQCNTCQRREAKDTWVAVVQMRQKVPHKRTFFWLEQLILKHRAHVDTVNIVQQRDGLDFFFEARAHAEKLVSFLESVAPVRTKNSKQLLAQDTHTGKGRYKFTFSSEVLPICRDDLLWLPLATARTLGNLSQLVLCSKMSNVIHVLDPRSLQTAELQPLNYWKAPFKASMSKPQLVEFVVLDVEFEEATGRQNAQSRARPSGAKFVRGEQLRLAEVTVARREDFGANDRTFCTVSHLGNVLKVGDYVWGYNVASSSLAGDLNQEDADRLPEVLLVKKSYSERRRKPRRRHWKLQQLAKENEPGVQRGRKMDYTDYDAEYEEFLQELEEDPSMRAQINLYRDPEVLPPARIAAAANAAAVSAQVTPVAPVQTVPALSAPFASADSDDGSDVDADADANDDDGRDEPDDDFPEVGLEELIDDLTLGADEGDEEGLCWTPGAPVAKGDDPVAVPRLMSPEEAAVAAAQVPQFTLPEGNDVKFYF